MSEIPKIELDARDVHAPGILKALAAKHRVTDRDRAQVLDAAADSFAAWKRANPSVR